MGCKVQEGAQSPYKCLCLQACISNSRLFLLETEIVAVSAAACYTCDWEVLVKQVSPEKEKFKASPQREVSSCSTCLWSSSATFKISTEYHLCLGMKQGQPIPPYMQLGCWLWVSLSVTLQAPAAIRACHGKWSMRTPWLLPPLRIQPSQMRQRGVTVSTSRRNYYRQLEKGFSESPVTASWSSHQKSSKRGAESKVGWIVLVPLPWFTNCLLSLPSPDPTLLKDHSLSQDTAC